jgi:hypothetical protein
VSIHEAIDMLTRRTYLRTEATAINALEITHLQIWKKIIKATPQIQQPKNRSVISTVLNIPRIILSSSESQPQQT